MSVCGLVLVRQRPGTGNAIFLTLEDEEAVANIIVWPRIFERYRAIVLGSRFIRVSGRLQSESGVIHIVAERMEDLTSWLGLLTEEAQSLRAGIRREEPQGTGKSAPKKSARHLPALVQNYEQLSHQAGDVMPKGRNFQ